MIICGQVLGCFGLLSLFVSLIYNKRKVVNKSQIIANIFYAGQYFCLNAMTGTVISIIVSIRYLIFGRFQNNNKKIPVIILLIFLGIIIAPIFFLNYGVIGMFLVIATIIYTIGIWSGKIKLLRVITLISSSLLIGYNVFVKAYPSLIGNIIELLTSFIAIYKFDLDEKIKESELAHDKINN